MKNQFIALLFTLVIYAFLCLANWGWGKIALAIIGTGEKKAEDGIIVIWLGWAFLLFIFQFLNIFVALNIFIVVPVFFVGSAFAIVRLASQLRQQQKTMTLRPQVIWYVLFLGLISFWLASRAMLEPFNYDSGLYHFNSIRWINTYPIVPGLGNLHGRLAFNQSYFLWIAALNFFPYFNHGRSIANSYLTLLALATLLRFLIPILKKPSLLLEDLSYHHLSILFTIPVAFHIALTFHNGLASPTPDLASIYLQLILFVLFVKFIEEWVRGEGFSCQTATILFFLAVTAITVKLSNLVFSAIICCLCLYHLWRNVPVRSIFRILLFNLVVMLLWMARSYILSGVPLYPSTVGYVAFDWSMPKKKIIDVANWIYSWARNPGPHWSTVLGNWKWLNPWFHVLTTRVIYVIEVIYPFLIGILFSLLSFFIFILQRTRKKGFWLSVTAILPGMVSLIYWFFTAPDPRFANASFWCFMFGASIFFLGLVRSIFKRRVFAIVLCCVFVLNNASIVYFATHVHYHINKISYSGWQPAKEVPLVKKKTSSGLVVFIPKHGGQCWDSPLPCAPFYRARLHLRIPGDLSSGFSFKVEKTKISNDKK